MSSYHPDIHIRNLSKKYQFGGPQQLYHPFRDAIVNTFKAPFKIFYQAPPEGEILGLEV